MNNGWILLIKSNYKLLVAIVTDGEAAYAYQFCQLYTTHGYPLSRLLASQKLVLAFLLRWNKIVKIFLITIRVLDKFKQE